MKKKPGIAFIGDLTVDRYIDKEEIRLGGAALNGAVWATRVGARASVVTAVGDDAVSRQFFELFQKENIDASRVSSLHGSTSSIEVHVDADGEKHYGEWDPGILANYHLKKRNIRFLKKCDAMVVTVYPVYLHVLDELGSVKVVHRKKPLIVVNFGDLREFGSDIRIVQQYAPLSDILVFGLNKDTDEAHINVLRQLAHDAHKMVIITLGEFGSLVYNDDTIYLQPAIVTPIVDTTGAGDAFLAAYMVKYLETGDVQKSLSAGSNIASQVIGRLGAY
ncbi:hypothetical protein A3A63_00735 [Candidatus Gottesmanbacteria bacterium RIFCSPLOWO2_01_FULL_46_9]|uniref:Carbohydrate kinase PfkB domain-containing protein n=1 Tax=Candidatus Gottesmanbacteria bacterium RIFCSPLOWO2_01_FULL_46_9 TaxID=1798394 RepID=A0A1F6B351_9BACT|nr:MAG: hypothetical protein A3A63_00735 [Candidatus Gottesmanbacteria bacterium RIFCSPLOWO2_01_FULL_46_9]